jgi:hypothetical protein
MLTANPTPRASAGRQLGAASAAQMIHRPARPAVGGGARARSASSRRASRCRPGRSCQRPRRRLTERPMAPFGSGGEARRGAERE